MSRSRCRRSAGAANRGQDYWRRKTKNGGRAGQLPFRQGLGNSPKPPASPLRAGGTERSPEPSLNRLCDLAVEAQIYRECVRYYPFVLGAQPVRPIDLAAFYAAIANEGLRPAPYAIESIERNGAAVYRHDRKSST